MPMRDARAQIEEIHESVVGPEKHGVVRVGLMQDGPADADNAPGKCGEHQERNYINPEAFVYIGFGCTASVERGARRGKILFSVQAIPRFIIRQATAMRLE